MQQSIGSQSRKWQETARRAYLPNGKIHCRNFRRSGEMKILQEAIAQFAVNKPLVYIPPPSPTANRLVKHYHEEITAHGSLPVVEAAL